MHALSSRNAFIAQALTYGGVLPLVFAIMAQYLKLPGIDALTLSRSYAALIISFICGTHWGMFVFHSNKCPHNLLITSTFTAMAGWASVLLPDAKIALVMQSLCFLYLMVLDYRMKRSGLIPTWYYALRHNATAIVIFCIFMLELS